MKFEWSESEAAQHIAAAAGGHAAEMAFRLYLDSLIDGQPVLNLSAAGYHSVKCPVPDLMGCARPSLLIRSRGGVGPAGYARLDLAQLSRLRALTALSDADLRRELLSCRRDQHDREPPAETLLHAFLPAAFIDQTVPEPILVLCSLPGARARILEALGSEVLVLEEAETGFAAALRAAELAEANPEARMMVWLHHGLVTWGNDARAACAALRAAVRRASQYVGSDESPRWAAADGSAAAAAAGRLESLAPVFRGVLAHRTGDPDRPFLPGILRVLSHPDALGFLESVGAPAICRSLPLHPDHARGMGGRPLWFTPSNWEDPGVVRRELVQAFERSAAESGSLPGGESGMVEQAALPRPRVILAPGLGLLAWGVDAAGAGAVADTAWRSLAARAAFPERLPPPVIPARPALRTLGSDAAIPEGLPQLAGHVALVTGAAGAIGAGICELLLEHGCHVAASDLAGPRLDDLVSELAARFPERVLGVVMDVTSPDSVREGFAAISRTWGGIDLLVPNAGIALVSSLAEMRLEDFRRAERINTEGTLLVLAEVGRHFRQQGTGGDVVLISTKNVFSPGAGFGAYSATKAAAHQLARIASLEMADAGVRVNMVSPDAVFSHGVRRSGLWEEVGPGRMRARGLDAAGLEEYYRTRNLLKARVTARHVARAVLFFATRQTPTTGATIPVDGGLPDSTPR